MGNTGNYIYYPVRLIQDVHRVLGRKGGIGQVITRANIKMWAKYKPVPHRTLSAITDAQRAQAGHGLTAPYVSGTTPLALISLYDGKLNGWSYSRPRGMAYNEPFRIRDFDKYVTNPSNPVRNYAPIETLIYDSGQSTTPFYPASFIAGIDANSIQLIDFAAVFNHSAPNAPIYFGVAFFKGENPSLDSLCTIATAASPITKNLDGTYSNLTVSFSKELIRDTHKGAWTMVPFLCDGQIEQEGAWSENPILSGTYTFHTIPYASVSQVEFMSRLDTYIVQFDGHKTDISLDGVVTIINNGTDTFDKDVAVYFWDDSVEPGSTPLTRSMEAHERRYEKHLTIPAGESAEWSVPDTSDPGIITEQLRQHAAAFIQIGAEFLRKYQFRTPSPIE